MALVGNTFLTALISASLFCFFRDEDLPLEGKAHEGLPLKCDAEMNAVKKGFPKAVISSKITTSLL
eukprot:7173978-Pyramimonas_sp.AAC.1